MAVRLGWLLLAVATLCSAEVIDRIAVEVGRKVITESTLLLEIRLTAFLNGDEPDFSATNRKATAERMIDQTLIGNEMELSQYPMPSAADATKMLDQIKHDRFPNDDDFRKALEKYHVTQDEIEQQLLKQIATLRFIDIRFRPGVQVLDHDAQDYYQKQFLPEWHNESKEAAPSFDEVRDKIEQTLLDQRVNQLVENWLKEARARTRINFMQKAFE